MKATASVLSSHTAGSGGGGMTVSTSNCMPPSYQTPMVVMPPSLREKNGDVSPNRNKKQQQQQQRPIQKKKQHHHLNGRTNLKQSLLFQQTQPMVFQRQRPLQPIRVRKESILIIPTKLQATSSTNTNTAPMLASSRAMMMEWSSSSAVASVDTNSRATLDDNGTVSSKDEERQPQLSRSLSALVLTDLVSASVRHGLPRKLVSRQIRRRRRQRRYFMETTSGTAMVSPASAQRPKVNYELVCIRGNPNFGGQSCFLNSVLQALASLTPFLAYLDRIVSLQHQRRELEQALSSRQTTTTTTASSGRLLFSQVLLSRLSHLNGNSVAIPCDAREVLRRLAASHPRLGGRRGQQVGTEQQDAHEVLQALLGTVIADAGLDGTAAATTKSAAVPPLDFSQPILENGQDSVLSLSSFVTRLDLEQQQRQEEEEKKDAAENASGYGANLEENGHFATREEKKLEDSDYDKTKMTNGFSNPMRKKEETDSSVQPRLSGPTRHMLETLSPATPSPLSGWIGSTLQCCTCHHVRPIQNAPFLDIPIVPTILSSSRYHRWNKHKSKPDGASSCTLLECLRDFSRVERVQNVECRSCTVAQELQALEEEIFMLRSAVNTVLARCKRQGQGNGEAQVAATKRELQAAEARHARLVNCDPDNDDDDDDDIFAVEHPDDEEFLVDNEKKKKKNKLIRGDANKCLLLTRMPTVLCLHVQRRYYDPVRRAMAKASQHVDFPRVLDLAAHCAYGSAQGGWTGKSSSPQAQEKGGKQRIWYKLQSIVEHRGNAHAGHYQTYRRAAPGNDDDKWVLVSDLHVTPLSWNQVKRAQAYMLFYEAI